MATKKQKQTRIIIGLIVLVAIVGISNNLFFIVGEETRDIYGDTMTKNNTAVTNEIKNIEWLGNMVNIQASRFGSYTSKSLPLGAGEICQDNDGDFSISNSLSNNNNQLIFSSSMGGGGQPPCGSNYIKSKITLPKGVLTGECVLTASQSGNGISVSKCSIGDFKLRIQMARNLAGAKSNAQESFQIIIEEETIIEIEIRTLGGDGAGASAQVILNFEETTDTIIDECTTHADCDNNLQCNGGSCEPAVCPTVSPPLCSSNQIRETEIRNGCPVSRCIDEPIEDEEPTTKTNLALVIGGFIVIVGVLLLLAFRIRKIKR